MIEVGTRCGRLLIVGEAKTEHGRSAWLCRCDCGELKAIRKSYLRRCAVKSCGCLKSDVMRAVGRASKTHGKTKTSEYRSWADMLSRCNNENHRAWKYYGGRGISVCERWRKFENFFDDMGERPVGCSIDRINNDGDYCPSNCRWATAGEQINNRGDLRGRPVVGPDGKRYISYSQAARAVGVGLNTIRRRCLGGVDGWRHACSDPEELRQA